MPDATSITWIDYLTAFGSIATPILVLALTGVGWQIRRRMERRAELEDKLREDRISTYNQILEPFIMLLSPDDASESGSGKGRGKGGKAEARRKLLSVDYRKAAFKMSLVGSDGVVTSFNNLMQHFYHSGESEEEGANLDELSRTTELLGRFLLEIRKSMGNDATKLDEWSMIMWWLKDFYTLRDRRTP